jgi:phenylacetic acid degradation operon negative regulatory protein
VNVRLLPATTPLTARSVALSTLLGYHPPELPVRALVKVGTLFGIAERTTRMALTRMVADGDVVANDGVYRLTERLLRRQARQDALTSPQVKDWNGAWTMAVVTGPARPLPERVALRKAMVDLRLAELREGVWIRPDNLRQETDGVVGEQCRCFTARYPRSDELVRELWDLDAWAVDARTLSVALAGAAGLVEGFLAIAQVVRHLLLDPYLPQALLPPRWPAGELRDRYREYVQDYADRLRRFSAS